MEVGRNLQVNFVPNFLFFFRTRRRRTRRTSVKSTRCSIVSTSAPFRRHGRFVFCRSDYFSLHNIHECSHAWAMCASAGARAPRGTRLSGSLRGCLRCGEPSHHALSVCCKLHGAFAPMPEAPARHGPRSCGAPDVPCARREHLWRATGPYLL